MASSSETDNSDAKLWRLSRICIYLHVQAFGQYVGLCMNLIP